MVDEAATGIRWERYAPTIAVDWVRSHPELTHRRVSGGLVFLDVSGFTAMTERLAELGSLGAEQITEVIGRTFERLLVPAYELGGSMLEFGGDAMLLWFPDDDGRRAARAAWLMRELLLAESPVTTRAGPMEVGVTMGVHAGEFDLALVGLTSRELIAFGRDVSETIRLEGSAPDNGILLSSVLAQRLPGAGKSVAGGRLLGEEPPAMPVRPLRPKPAGDAARVRALLPAPVAAHLAGGAGSEHRMAVVAFLHWEGTDVLAAAEGGAAAADAIAEIISTAHREAEALDLCVLGTDADIDGGKVILVAGIPATHEDDPDRALRCLRRVIDTPRRLALRVGVARGNVFAGSLGPAYRKTFTILGDTVNTAARVMAQARSEEILATAETLNAAHTLFEVEAREPFRAKGKALPVHTLAIGAEAGIRWRLRHNDYTLVGREPELARLTAAVDDLGDGRGAVLALTGPAGIGKSRLVDELQERRPSVPFALATCFDTTRDRGLHAVSQVARAIIADSRSASNAEVLSAARRLLAHDARVELLPLLGVLLGEEIASTPAVEAVAPQFRADVLRGLVMQLFTAARPGPLVLVIEDYQWVDAESDALLTELAGQLLDSLPWLLVFTAREAKWLPRLGLDPGVRSELVEVPALSPDQAKELALQEAERGTLAVDRVDEIVSRAQGNPLLVSDLAAVVASGAEGVGELAHVVRERLDQLAPRDRRVLSEAAVLGAEFDRNLFVAVAGPDAVSSHQLSRLQDFLEPGRPGMLRFSHGLYQEVAYESMPFRDRERIHALAAQAIEEWPDLPERDRLLSLHWFRAADHERAWRYSMAAAERAVATGSSESAAALLRRALVAGERAGRSSRELGRAEVALGRALRLAGSLSDAAKALERAVSLLDGRERTRIRVELASGYEELGDYDRCLAELDAIQPDDPELDALCWTERSVIYWRRGDPAAAEQAARPGTAAADPRTRGRALFSLGFALALQGKPGAIDACAEAHAILLESGDLVGAAKALGQQSSSHYFDGDWTTAVAVGLQAQELMVRVGDRVSAAIVTGNLAEIRADQGRAEEALRLAESASRVHRATGHIQAAAWDAMILGRASALLGEFDSATRHYAAAHTTSEEIRSRSLAAQIRAYQIEATFFAGEHPAAAESAAAALEGSGGQMRPLLLRVQGCAQLALGRVSVGRALLEQSLSAAVELHDGYQRLLTEACLHDAGSAVAPEQALVDRFDIADLPLVQYGPARSLAATRAPR